MLTTPPRIEAMARVRSVVERHYGLAQVALVVAFVESYELLRHVMTPNWQLALQHAQKVVSWEQVAHIEWEEGLQQTFLSAGAIVAPIAFATPVHHASWRVAFVLAALSPLVGYAVLSPLAERRP